MAAITPYWDPADAITCHAEAAVTGGRFVAISGPAVDGNPQVSPAGAAVLVLGVAEHDADAGDTVTVARVGIWPVTAGEALTAGMVIASGAAGVAVEAAAGEIAAGVVVDDADNAADAPIAIHVHSVPV